MDYMLWVWLGVAVVAAMIEASTVSLVAIWIVIGSVFALISAALGMPLFGQFIVLFVVSIVLLIFTRPIMVKKLQVGKYRTNADSLIGATCFVTEDINNLMSTGSVKLNGLTWTARTEDNGITIKKGEKVNIKAIAGVKLVVNKSE